MYWCIGVKSEEEREVGVDAREKREETKRHGDKETRRQVTSRQITKDKETKRHSNKETRRQRAKEAWEGTNLLGSDRALLERNLP